MCISSGNNQCEHGDNLGNSIRQPTALLLLQERPQRFIVNRDGLVFIIGTDVNKTTLIKKIIEHLAAELAVYHKAARAAHAEATHEQSRAENKYDTRGLEASYLARGQSKQAAEIAQAMEQFQKIPERNFEKSEPIDIGALIELKGGGESSFYFMGPRAGGTEVACEKKEILVITPQSPLGQQLVGKKQGERVLLTIGPTQEHYKIVSVE
jgi:transcription elongation GreA/GreB family factor